MHATNRGVTKSIYEVDFNCFSENNYLQSKPTNFVAHFSNFIFSPSTILRYL